ncbi:MAG: hypothetical protein N839_0010330 [Desulfofustis sp. PB-SRB1]|jgi:hypothetical protein|nr:hypothetical protein [Desulfofustis sp. PB-SRB1]MBM1002796.1 hypothetical protein [Desulfofustis sp. PB-SRB1]
MPLLWLGLARLLGILPLIGQNLKWFVELLTSLAMIGGTPHILMNMPCDMMDG